MDKLRKIVHPYTFRSRMMRFLVVSSIIAGCISLISSFLYTAINLREELALNQQAVAIYLLELDQATNMSAETLVNVTDSDLLSVNVGIVSPDSLPESLRKQIDEALITTYSNSLVDKPATYLKLDDSIIRLTSSNKLNIITIAMLRISMSVVSFLLVFMMMSLLTARSIARPVTQLTQATRLIGEGDFSVRLPENVPGEVGELMHSFNGMTEALGRTSYLQKDFISSISHEFRTPIASIRGFARLLQMDGLDEATRKEYVDLIAQESDRLSRLSETLLRLSALEQQAAPACMSEFRLDEQIRQVILRLEPAWSSRNIDWQLNLQPVTIKSDSELLVQVWINLIQNAVKFSDDNSSIELSVSQGERAEVCIRDHGVGMDEATLERIFDRFYQADRSRSKQGVGLGLCLVKRILDILQGSVKVESVLNEGSAFYISLPLIPNYKPTNEEKNS